MDVIAAQGDPNSQLTVFHNTGSKQRSPFRYGSAFSRSTVVRRKNGSTIHISGTASIGEDGVTLGVDSFAEQVRNTLDAVGSLIKPEGATFKDICQATVFLKRADDLLEYKRVMGQLGLENIPAVCVLADVCRDELLFEIDGIAIVK
jgi:enamine deaminase RidA (YjgF/YER057c/UK114 family)